MAIELQDYFTKLTFGGTFARTFALWWDSLILYTCISLLFYIPYLLCILAVPSFRDALRSDDPTKSKYFGANMILLYTMEFTFSVLVGIAGQASIGYSVILYYIGRGRPKLWTCIKRGCVTFCDLFGATLIVAFGLAVVCAVLGLVVIVLETFLGNRWSTRVLAAIIAVLVCLPIFCFCLVPLALLSPIFVIERPGPLNGIRQLWQTSYNHRSYIFGTSFVLGLFNLVCSAYIGVFFKGYRGVILSNLPFVVYFPIKAILVTIVYLNICIERNELSRSQLLEKVGLVDDEDPDPNEFPYTLLGNDDEDNGKDALLDDALEDTVLEFNLEETTNNVFN